MSRIGCSISLLKWEGAATGSLGVNDGYVSHLITTSIPTNKIVVLSLSGVNAAEANHESVKLTLVNANGQEVSINTGTIWQSTSRMVYFRTSGPTQQYTARVYSNAGLTSYTINVAVTNCMQFIPCDTRFYGGAYASSTYMISNTPEYLNCSFTCRGDTQGKYLTRARVKGCARLYWEHYNQLEQDIKFGVLLWNKSNAPIVVSLAARSNKTGMTDPACLDVWSDCFNVWKQPDNSELPTTGSVTIPAYNSSNPSASALWVAMYTESAAGVGFFNGLVGLTLENTDGSLYLGDEVLCDAYIMAGNYPANLIKANVQNMSLAPFPIESDSPALPLRGSGTGAGLYAPVSEIAVSSQSPYSILITGDAVPLIRPGEKIALYDSNSQCVQTLVRENGLNYGVAYEFAVDKFTSTGTIKGKIVFNEKTNPNWVMPYPGLYVVGYIYGQPVFQKLITYPGTAANPSEFVFSTNIPKNQPVFMTFVVSGMSCMPLEIQFYN